MAAYGMGDLVRRLSPDPLMIIEGLLPADVRLMQISGPSKAGKTMLALELVYTLATGRSFLGLFPPVEVGYDYETHERIEPWGPTLYLQLENSAYSMERRAQAIIARETREDYWYDFIRSDGDSEHDDLTVRLNEANDVFVRMENEFSFDNKENVDRLVDELQDYRFLVIDSIYLTVSKGSLNDMVYATGLAKKLKWLARETNTTIIVIHHASEKGEYRGKKARESMGSTFFTAAFWDLTWRVDRDKRNHEFTIELVARDYDFDPVKVQMTELGRWQRAEVVDKVAQLTAWLEERELEVGPKGSGVGVKGYTFKKIADELGWSTGTVSSIMQDVYAAKVAGM